MIGKRRDEQDFLIIFRAQRADHDVFLVGFLIGGRWKGIRRFDWGGGGGGSYVDACLIDLFYSGWQAVESRALEQVVHVDIRTWRSTPRALLSQNHDG